MNFNVKSPLISLLIFFLLHTKISAQDPDFHIYLCFGQSNMEGVGVIDPQDRVTNPRVRLMQDMTCSNLSRVYGSWYTAAPPLARCYGRLGIADYFGKTMAEKTPSHITIGLAVAAYGGADIAFFQKGAPLGKAAKPGDVAADIPSQFTGGYEWLLDLGKKAQQSGVIKGFIFHQGEANSNDPNWKYKVQQVVNDLRADLGTGNVPFLAGELLYADYNSCCSIHNIEINKLPSLIPEAYVVSANGLPGQDIYHFNPASYREYGKRYAGKMLPLISISNAVPSVKIISPADGLTFPGGSSVTIAASASDEDGTISKVEFFNGRIKLGEDLSYPYSFSWNDVEAGNYLITSAATDDEGSTRISEPVSVMFDPNSTELLSNNEFDNGTENWSLLTAGGASSSMTVVTDSSLSGADALKICPLAAGTSDWHIQLQQRVPLEAGASYDLSFLAKSDEARNVTVAFQKNTTPFTLYNSKVFNLTIAPVEYSYSFTANTTDPESLLKFFAGNNKACIYLDKIMLIRSSLVTAVKTSDDFNVNLFPNPFSEMVTLETNGDADYFIYNLSGELVASGRGRDKIIFGKNLSSGIYYLKVSENESTRIFKIVRN
jgi:hypothetical protein